MPDPTQPAVVKAAKAADADFPKLDKDNDRKLSFKEFAEMSLPGLSDDLTRRAIFDKIAGRDGDKETVSRADLKKVLAGEPELVTEATVRIGNRLMSTQAGASEKVIDLFLQAGGKASSELFNTPSIYTTARNIVEQSFANNMRAPTADPAVQEAVSKSPSWQLETANLRQMYFNELESDFKSAKSTPKDLIQKMVTSAVTAKDYQALSSLDFVLTRFAPDRKDLQEIRAALPGLAESVRPKDGPPSILAQVQFDLHRMNEQDSMKGQSFVNAAREAGVPIKDKEFAKGIGYSEAQTVRLAELKTAGAAAENPGDLWFDRAWRGTASGLAKRYGGEEKSVLQGASAEQLIALYQKLSDKSPKNADSIFSSVVATSDMPKEHAQKLISRGVELGHTPDSQSPRAADRMLSSLIEYVQGLAAPSR